MAGVALAAAKRSGAGPITVLNLYGYGPVGRLITERTAVRPQRRAQGSRASRWGSRRRGSRGRPGTSERGPRLRLHRTGHARPAWCPGMLTAASEGRSPWLPMGRVDAPTPDV